MKNRLFAHRFQLPEVSLKKGTPPGNQPAFAGPISNVSGEPFAPRFTRYEQEEVNEHETRTDALSADAILCFAVNAELSN